jgi:hypothetical protein
MPRGRFGARPIGGRFAQTINFKLKIKYSSALDRSLKGRLLQNKANFCQPAQACNELSLAHSVHDRLERFGGSPRASTAGVDFIEENSGGLGVRLRKRLQENPRKKTEGGYGPGAALGLGRARTVSPRRRFRTRPATLRGAIVGAGLLSRCLSCNQQCEIRAYVVAVSFL